MVIGQRIGSASGTQPWCGVWRLFQEELSLGGSIRVQGFAKKPEGLPLFLGAPVA
jgi:hypothetical protein